VVPESSLVRGQIELEYRNFSEDTLSQIHFTLKEYCRIDSILYYGAPLSENEISVDNTIMKVKLPVKLAPEATGFFLMAFESNLATLPVFLSDEGHSVTFNNWYPHICIYKNGRWYDNQSLSEYADYNVSLEIDSTYSIAHPGELRNEKEHYGLQPQAIDDIVYVDILNKHSFAFGGVRYHPTFPDGVKQYSIRARYVTDFPFFVTREFLRDRTFVDDLVIEVCYNQKTKHTWTGFVARSTGVLIRQFEKWLGKFPYRNLTVVAGDGLVGPLSAQQLIVVPAVITDTCLLYTALANGVANCLFSPTVPDSSNTGAFFNEGLAHYVTIRALYSSLGIEGYRMVREYKTLLTNLLKNEPWSPPYIATVFHKIPSQIHALRFAISDKALLTALEKFVRRFRHEFPDDKDFFDVVKETCNRGQGNSLNEWLSANHTFDLGVSKVKANRIDGRLEISYEVGNFGSIILPIEVGFVTSAIDTIYDTLRYNQLPRHGVSSVFHKKVSTKPRAIVLDPNHYLPDVDRSNNYAFMLPIRFRYRPPVTLFPSFDNLK
jgi:hypothetical protein